MGDHGVRRVAHEDDAVGVPALERREVEQRPARADVGRADHLGHGGVPAGVRVDGVADLALLHPRVGGPFRGADDGEEVDGAAAVDRVVQEVAPRPRPELQRRRIGERRHGLDGHEPAVADRPREPPADLADHVRADHRVHAVGADDQVGGRARPVRELQLGARVALVDADAAAAEVHPLVREPVGERLQQRDAMDAVVGRAERRFVDAVATHRVVGDDLAAVPAPDDQRRWDDRDGFDLLAEPEPPQLARAVGRQRDRGADLAQLVRLLVDLEADPALAQREREDQPTDAAADDGDLQPGHRSTRSPSRGRARARSRS